MREVSFEWERAAIPPGSMDTEEADWEGDAGRPPPDIPERRPCPGVSLRSTP